MTAPVRTAQEALRDTADTIKKALADGAISDKWAWVFVDTAKEIDTALGIPVDDLVGVTVKPLEWKNGSHKTDVSDHVAQSVFGEYSCRNIGGQWTVWLSERSLGNKSAGNLECYLTLREAKAAAQADYERRVLSCLTVGPDPRVEALKIALKPFANAVYNDNGDVTIDQSYLRATDWLKALAAFADDRPAPPAEGEDGL